MPSPQHKLRVQVEMLQCFCIMYCFKHNRAAEEGQFSGFEAHGILYCLELEHWNCCFVKIVFGGGNMGGFCDQAKVPWLCRNVTD